MSHIDDFKCQMAAEENRDLIMLVDIDHEVFLRIYGGGKLVHDIPLSPAKMLELLENLSKHIRHEFSK